MLNMNQKTYVACNLKYFFENEELLKVTVHSQ